MGTRTFVWNSEGMRVEGGIEGTDNSVKDDDDEADHTADYCGEKDTRQASFDDTCSRSLTKAI